MPLDAQARQEVERLAAEAKTVPLKQQSYFHKNAVHMLAWDDQSRVDEAWQQQLAQMRPIVRYIKSGNCKNTFASMLPFLVFGAALYGIGSLIFMFLPEHLLPTAWVCWTIVLVGLILAQRLDRLTARIESLGRRS